MSDNSKSKEKEGNIKLIHSVKFNLITTMIVVVVTPLILSILVSYFNSMHKSQIDAETINLEQAKLVAKEFSTTLNQQMRTLEAVANNPYTIEFVKKGSAITQADSDRMISFLDTLNVPYGDGNNIVISAATGDQLVRTGGGNLSNISDRQFFKDAMTGKEVLSDVLVSKATGSRIIVPAVPVYDDDYKTVIGIAQRSYDLSVLHQLLVSNIDENQRAFITDGSGIVIAHSDYEIAAEDEEDNRSDRPFFNYAKQSSEGSYLNNDKGDEKNIVSYYKEPETGWIVVMSTNYNKTMLSARKSANLTIFVAIVMTIIAIFRSVSLARSFTKPMSEVNHALRELADGEFSVIEKYTDRKDEFGEMVNNTNTVLDHLGRIVHNIKQSSLDVKESSEELAEAASQISQTTEDVSNAVQEIASGATQQADEIQEATENVEKIGNAITDVQESSDDLSGIAQKMKKASEVSSNSLKSLQESSTEMTEKIEEISRTIQATKEAVNVIGEKVMGITNIATQTNLLSLNASIEAARAGEAGKGFAVVAGEIGTLAEDSKKMADDIKVEMSKLLEQSDAAVVAADGVKEGNSEQQVALSETFDAVSGMLEDIEKTVVGVQSITEGANVCDKSKDAVIDTMSALSAISEENAASSEETGASMQELSATVITLASSADTLKDISKRLSTDIAFFKI